MKPFTFKVCVELAKVLIHKANNYGIDDFEELRANGLVAITIHYPIEVSVPLSRNGIH
jgi:hypothetical protein